MGGSSGEFGNWLWKRWCLGILFFYFLKSDPYASRVHLERHAELHFLFRVWSHDAGWAVGLWWQGFGCGLWGHAVPGRPPWLFSNSSTWVLLMRWDCWLCWGEGRIWVLPWHLHSSCSGLGCAHWKCALGFVELGLDFLKIKAGGGDGPSKRCVV